MAKVVLAFVAGLIIGAVVCGWALSQGSDKRIAEIGGQLESSIRDNKRLADRLIKREALDYSLAESADQRQRNLDRSESELESSKSSIAKIRSILEDIAAGELGGDTGGSD